ncbi:MAG: hypothetical protein LBG50_04115 [Clostridiales Family XIII bacterium]|nr:hypothetical protein [Clostridiales Family XIII bacterium]
MDTYRINGSKRFVAIVIAALTAVAFMPFIGGAGQAHAAGVADVWDGTADTSWYNTTGASFTIGSAAELAGFALIVNNKPEVSSAGAVDSTVVQAAKDAYDADIAGTAHIADKDLDPSIPADDFLGKTVTLAADIDLGGVEVSAGVLSEGSWTTPVWSGNEWTPIGSYTSSGSHTTGSGDGVYGRPFKGTFDGGNHRISNLYVKGNNVTGYDNPQDNSHALFGDLGRVGLVKNIIVASGYVRGDRFAGGIVGRGWGHIESCMNYATVETDGSRSGGGIAGVSYKNGDGSPYIKNSANFGTIATGDGAYPGGIVSDNEGVVSNCYNVGKGAHKSKPNYTAGGIVGGGRAKGTVINSWSISGEGYPSRIIGYGETAPPAGCGFAASSDMKGIKFLALFGGAFDKDSDGINDGYPVLVGLGKAFAEAVADEIDDLNNKLKDKDAENSKVGAGKAAAEADKAKLEAEKAKLEAEKAALQKQLDAASQTLFKASAPKLSKVKAGKKQAAATWKKLANAQGYQLVYSTSKSFKGKKTLSVKNAAAVKQTVKGLKGGKKYYFKLRGYAKIGGKTVYSKWSGALSAKIKK